MSTKNLLKSKKAITPILATLLLIVIAVAAIVVTYAWVMTYISSAGTQAGVMLKKDSDFCLWKTGNVTIYIRNKGTSDAEIDKVYINSVPQTSVSYSPSKIVDKDGGTITIVVNYNWQADTEYHFQISPKLGEPLSFDETSP